MKRVEEETEIDPVDRLRQGEYYDSFGNPIAFGLDINKLTAEDIQMLMQRRQDDAGGSSKV